jgi:hypothetical protein
MSMSAGMKLAALPMVKEMMVDKQGYPESTIRPIGAVEAGCVAFYLIPQTAVVGAILMTGYLGGAIATHVHANDPNVWTPLVLGMMTWGGLFLRDGRVRQLIPIRFPESKSTTTP